MELYEIYHDTIPDFLAWAAALPPMLRLKQVGMNCGCEYTRFPQFSGVQPYSRFQHSLGVGLIVWHFTGSEKQALAGLLHDVATPVFSHVVDFLNGDYLTQESTEADTQTIIQGSAGLQQLLVQRGLDTGDVADYHSYPIADNASPRLSADRLEYTLHNAVNFGFATPEQIRALYADLAVGSNEAGGEELVFCSRESAEDFAFLALRCGQVYTCDADRYAMQMLSELLSEALQTGVISRQMLGTTEPEVIGKLENSCLEQQWRAFCGCSRIFTAEEPAEDGHWRKIFAKKRYIDPYVAGAGRVSQLSPEFARAQDAFLETSFDYWVCAR